MKKNKLAKIALLGMASTFCLSAQDAAPSEHEGEVAMHKKSEENVHKDGCSGKKGCNGKGGKGKNGPKRGGSCGGPGGCRGENGRGKNGPKRGSGCGGSSGCSGESSYNDQSEEEAYQALRAKRYKNAEGN